MHSSSSIQYSKTITNLKINKNTLKRHKKRFHRSLVFLCFSNMWIIRRLEQILKRNIEISRPDKIQSLKSKNKITIVTKKGCLMFERIVFSEIMWSTCLSRRISDFLSILSATYSPDFLSLASLTLPKDPIWLIFFYIPVPSVNITS